VANTEAIDDPTNGKRADVGAMPDAPLISDPVETFTAPTAHRTPNAAPNASTASTDEAAEDAAVAATLPARLTASQQMRRALAVSLACVVCATLLAPFLVALVTAFVAILADALALANIVWLLVQGELLQADIPLRALSIASRLGLMAIGYLGLLCALMTLLAGLLGRGRGRLFIIPGALLTASALALFAASVGLAWPLLAPLALPRVVLLAIALYLTLATVALATLLADTQQTRARWRRARALVGAAPRRRASTAARRPPTLVGA
jgi:hypothetical protein